MLATNDITFSITYYGQLDRLVDQLEFFTGLPEHVKEKIVVQIINDGYNDAGAFEDVCRLYEDRMNLKAYEVTEDVGFNNHGCRNLMMMESDTTWNMLMDIDVYLKPDIVEAMATYNLLKEKIYCFKVKFDHPDDPADYEHFDPKKILKWITHPNTWLITKPAFWTSGGDDIEFTGMRHGDSEFFLSLDTETYDHIVFHNEKEFEVHVQRPNRSRSYLNQATEHVKLLTKTVDFVTKRNEDKDRKFKKRLYSFPWKRII